MSMTMNRAALSRLDKVSIDVKLIPEECDGTFFPVTKSALVKSVASQLTDAGIAVTTDATFLPMLIVEVRYRVSLNRTSFPLGAVAKIESALHETVVVARNSLETTVDTWRHRVVVGAYAGTPRVPELVQLLESEIARQVEQFIADAQRQRASSESGSQVVRYPFPQNARYRNGIVSSTPDSGVLRAKFQSWMSNYYVEQGALARIRSDAATRTVSEGIGYALLMLIFFSERTRSYRSEFDKLWNYHQRFLDANGLMNWRIAGFDGTAPAEPPLPVGSGSATDADTDVASALILAYYQFGDQKYLDAARRIISIIRQNDFEPNGLHRPGDAWNDVKNPSYIAPAAYELFKLVDDSGFWQKAIVANYQLLTRNSHPITGFVSNWAKSDGSIAVPPGSAEEPDRFSFDASRSPWRLSWAIAWYGHGEATAINDKIAAFVQQATNGDPKKIPSGYIRSSGNPDPNLLNPNPVLTGSIACSAMCKSVYQEFLDQTYDVLKNMPPDVTVNNSGYFQASMQLLTLLLASGNMPNLSTM